MCLLAQSCLPLAAESGDVKLVAQFLSRGANIDEMIEDGFTGLILAARAQQDVMVEYLLVNKANPNAATTKRSTAILVAALKGREAMCQHLIKHGADVSMALVSLCNSCEPSSRAALECLLKAGAEPNKPVSESGGPDCFPLVFAAQADNLPACELLLKHGANPKAVNDHSKITALAMAARKGSKKSSHCLPRCSVVVLSHCYCCSFWSRTCVAMSGAGCGER